MKTHYPILAAAFAFAFGAFAQEAQQPLEFEAASVKPSAHTGPEIGVSAGGRRTLSSYSGCSGGPGTTDPGRFTCTNSSMRILVERAWALRDFQLAGPGTLDSAMYDIEAKVPAGTTEDQFREMLKKLLTDRFHMTMHHEKREQEVYALRVGKDGHHLQVPQPGDNESPRDALTKKPNGDGKANTKNSPNDMDPRAMAMMKELRGQLEAARAGRAGRAGGPPPSHVASVSTNGITRTAGRRATMADLARILSNRLNKPVVDQTGLAGEWNFLVEYAADSLMNEGPMAAMRLSLRQSPGSAAPAETSTEPSTPNGAPSIFSAFQKQLGLKLEVAKEPGDVLVVDKFEKAPAEN